MKNKRYKVVPHINGGRYLTYLVIDTFTGTQISEKDCQLWAEHIADKLNKIKKEVKNDCKGTT